MGLARLLLPGLALALLASCRPAGKEVAVRDASEASIAVTLPAETMFVNKEGQALSDVAGDRTLGHVYLASPGAQFQRPDHESSAPISPPVVVEVSPERPEHVEAPSVNNSSDAESRKKSFGVTYDPYCANHECKTKEQIAKDFEHFGSKFSMVRVYGTDCGQLSHIRAAAKKHNMKVLAGIWDVDAARVGVDKIVDVFQDDWAMVHSVSVGNEKVQKDEASAAEMAAAVSKVRVALRGAGYQGPVVTVDTFDAYLKNPALAQASDYCAVNAHPFFDKNTAAEDAGKWLQGTVDRMKKICNSKKIIVTETGWPTKGDCNGQAEPGLAKQRAAISAIKNLYRNNPEDLVLHSAFDSRWKTREDSTYNAEQYWGLDGAVSHTDSSMTTGA